MQGKVGATARIFGDRFQATRILWRAGDITTYHGRDLQRHAEVVIQTAPGEGFGTTARVRLDYELAILNEHGDRALRGALHAGAEGDVIYLVRPFIAGISLAERLREGPLAVEDSVRIGISVLSSLARIHPHGVLHRDIRPSNVILPDSRSDRAQLIDFGVIRHPRVGDAIGGPSLEAAEHLSPEQSGLIDAPLDARSDLYSVGVVLYESLAGRPPFVGRTVGEILRQHLTARPPPLARIVPGISRTLDRIIERLLHRDPRARYQTAAGALADLEALATGDQEADVVIGA